MSLLIHEVACGERVFQLHYVARHSKPHLYR